MSNDELLKVLAGFELNTRDYAEPLTLEQMRFKLQTINAICNVCLNDQSATTKFFNDRHDARVNTGNQSLFDRH